MASTPEFDPAHLYRRLQSLLLSMSDVNTFLTELAKLATTVVSEPSSCGITLRYDGNLLTVGSSDARAEWLDETQYQTGQGPCLDSLRTGLLVEMADSAAERRWPDYLPRAKELGLRCSLSLPLAVLPASTLDRSGSTSAVATPTGSESSRPETDPDRTTFGALNVYSFTEPDVFSPQITRQLEVFAAQAAGTLRLAMRQTKDATLLNQMEEALSSRTVIDQAIGIIIAQQRCPADAAFDLLRRESQNSRRRLRDIAAELVTRASGHPPDPAA